MLYGYGEDALTLVLLGTHADAFVRALEPGAPPGEPTVIYRPSFGRRATRRNRAGDPVVPIRAEFGEFDAIVATAAATYLVEVKWSGSGGVAKDGTLRLADRQVRRHRVMRHYVEAWRARPSGAWPTWSAFATHHDGEGRDIATRLSAEGVAVAEDGTRLAETLRDTLTRLAEAGPVCDVVLFARTRVGARRPRRDAPTQVCPPTFTLVVADVGVAADAGASGGPLMRLALAPDAAGVACTFVSHGRGTPPCPPPCAPPDTDAPANDPSP